MPISNRRNYHVPPPSSERPEALRDWRLEITQILNDVCRAYLREANVKALDAETLETAEETAETLSNQARSAAVGGQAQSLSQALDKTERAFRAAKAYTSGRSDLSRVEDRLRSIERDLRSMAAGLPESIRSEVNSRLDELEFALRSLTVGLSQLSQLNSEASDEILLRRMIWT